MNAHYTEGAEDMNLGSLCVVETMENAGELPPNSQPVSCKDTLQRNNPNLTFNTRDNPIWTDADYDDLMEDDEPSENEDPTCPTILLTAAEKRMLREPWRNALIVRMFDNGIGYTQLKRRLKTKWALKGDFSLIDIE